MGTWFVGGVMPSERRQFWAHGELPAMIRAPYERRLLTANLYVEIYHGPPRLTWLASPRLAPADVSGRSRNAMRAYG